MNLLEAIKLVISRRKRIEYTAWERYVDELRDRHAEEVIDLKDSVEYARQENLNEEWNKFNGGAA